ncbi:HEPN domain-containing protein [Pseudoalteromonas rhizosphaerae]|uniref:HEPN domain-containing protein n=1 Tax=Pseudoalteromonas rhizosphaerae TaxID=2518973 RepID=A0ABW8KYF9_9GAMM
MVESFDDITLRKQNGKGVVCKIEKSITEGVKIFPSQNFSEDNNLYEECIHGSVEEKKWSFINNRYEKKTTHQLGNEPISSLIKSSCLIIGDSYLSDTRSLNVLKYSCEIPLARIFFCENHSYAEQDYLNLASYKKNLFYESGITIELSYHHDFNLGKSVLKINIESQTGQKLERFDLAVADIITLMSFSLGKVISKQNEVVFCEEGDFSLFRESWFKSVKSSSCSRPPLFFVRSISQGIFDKWLKFRQHQGDLFNLYYLTLKFPMDNSTVFILRSQLVEGLHRQLSENNEFNYVDRLKSIFKDSEYIDFVEEFISRQEINKLCNKLKNARNYYTHYNKDDEFKRLNREDIIFDSMKLDLFIDLYIMKNIGLRKDYFENIKCSVIKDRLFRKQIIKQTLNS